jgi:V8-like Glu-specific endopeptidase
MWGAAMPNGRESTPGGSQADVDSALFPPRLQPIEGVADLDERALSPDEYARILESICGVADDSQNVERYDGTLGVSTAFVNARQRPVGQVQWNNNLASIYTNPGDVSGVRWGSGTLISGNLFLTAGHLFDQTDPDGDWQRPLQNGTTNIISPQEIATNMHVNFDYQFDPDGNLRPEQSFAITQLVEYRLGDVDFAIVRLAGNPVSTFGTSQISRTDAAVGDMACIIGHPAGRPKRIEAGPVTALSGTRISYNSIDTLGGNSGSGILRAADGLVVGVHTNGGCAGTTPETGENFGQPISAIISNSPTIQAFLRWSKRADNTPAWSDASGWGDVANYSTMHLAVANNDLYLLARTDAGVDTWRFDTASSTWSKRADNTPAWSDASGWDDVANYSTMHLAVANNDLYLLARTDAGVDTWRFDTHR